MDGTYYLLVGAGLCAGFVNAVAGGGTILTFPTLLLIGEDSIRANATSTLALILGISGSIYGYRRQYAAVRDWLIDFTPCSLLGGLVGSVLLTVTPSRWFDFLVPFLLLFATLLFMVQGMVASRFSMGTETHRPTAGAIALQFFIALYGGYFGAGIGILMLATLGLIGLRDINHMNAVKTILGGLINVVASIYFIYKGFIDWPKMWAVAAGALPGYYLGSLFSQRIPPSAVRRCVIGIGLGIAAYLFWQKFLRAP